MRTPKKQEILELEKAFIPYAEKELKGSHPEIWKDLSQYKRQYHGDFQRGKRQIAIFFFHASTDVVKEGKWRNGMIVVMGGGYYFFNVTYDMESRTFQKLWINAPI